MGLELDKNNDLESPYSIFSAPIVCQRSQAHNHSRSHFIYIMRVPNRDAIYLRLNVEKTHQPLPVDLQSSPFPLPASPEMFPAPLPTVFSTQFPNPSHL